MNRPGEALNPERYRFPHTRGGGPVGFFEHLVYECVFPTRVGVDLRLSSQEITPDSFPHTRGGGPRPPSETK